MRFERVDPPPTSGVSRSLLDEADSLVGALHTLVERSPDLPCLTILSRTGNEEQLLLADVWRRARRIELAFREAGLEPNDAVILILPTGPELVSAYFGVMLAGGIPGLVATPSTRLSDHRYYAERAGAILSNARARALYCDQQVADLFAGDEARHLAGARIVTPEQVPETEATSSRAHYPAGEDIATIQYSSGSTGTPRGLCLSHRAMLNNIRAIRDCLRLTPEDVSVNWVPLYHDMGLIDGFLLPLLTGSASVLIPTMDFMADPSIWLWGIHRHRGTLSWAPNFAYSVCANRVTDGELEGLDLSSWRIAINGAEPILASSMSAFSERFASYGLAPATMTPAFGLAENVTMATNQSIDEPPVVEMIDRQALATENLARRIDGDDGLPSVCLGRAVPGCSVAIRDPETYADLPERSVGRICFKSNSLFTTFHNAESQTAEVFHDGWLDSEDEGYLVGDELFFVSRVKDLIVIGGDKYAPHDIEALINDVDGVRKGCVVAFGVVNTRRGTEEVAAVIETREADAQRRAALEREVKRTVVEATGLVLRYAVLVPPGGVEKTTSGKLARRATRVRHADRLPA